MHLKALLYEERTNSLENHVPHINVRVEFNQDMLEYACEHRNRLQREQHAR
jgi:hypothetical protein